MTDHAGEWRCMWEARVKMPCDMDLNQLRGTIEKSKEVLADLAPGSEPAQDHAALIKDYCDANFAKNWHVVVGRHFGVHCIHDAKQFAFFYVGEIAVLVTRTQ
mmetsp:Transcript_613/g.1603  ORF Transcript_613/g.1603 Transcript_613/m.1603 type:complete len:103 (+) Transcript_613:1292-1600(+)